jgi:hypothetical protein
LWRCAIAGSIPVEWIIWQIMLQIRSIIWTWPCGEEEWKSASRRRNTSVPTLLTAWLMFHVSHLLWTPPPGPISSAILNSAVFQADRQWWKAVALRAKNVRLIWSINDESYIPICHMPLKYVWWIRSTISVAANRNLHF